MARANEEESRGRIGSMHPPRFTGASEYLISGPLRRDKLQLVLAGMSMAEQKARYKDDLPLAVSVTDKRLAQVAEVREVLIDFGREEFGVDLSDRIPPVDRFHFVQQSTWENPIEENGRVIEIASTLGFVATEEQIDDEATTIAYTGHGAVHAASRSGIVLKDNTLTIKHRNLEGPKNGLLILNEAVTELTSVELRRTRWDKILEPVRAGNILYTESTVTMEEVVAKAARLTGKTYKETIRGLQYGMVEGDRRYVRPLAEAYGTEGMRALVDWKRVDDVGTDEIIDRLGLPQAREKIDALRAGEAVDWFDHLHKDTVITTQEPKVNTAPDQHTDTPARTRERIEVSSPLTSSPGPDIEDPARTSELRASSPIRVDVPVYEKVIFFDGVDDTGPEDQVRYVEPDSFTDPLSEPDQRGRDDYFEER